jgi:peptidoglycan-associated lipoprotein
MMSSIKISNPQNIFVLLLAFVLAGCASTATEPPEEEVAPPVDEVGMAPEPVEPPQEFEAFDPDLNPYVPGTNRLLPRTFYFEFDRAVLGPDDLAALEMHATVLRNNRDRSVVIEGHCDERGTREYNLALGERRADAIRSYLTTAGVSPRQIETVSYGEERPEDPGHSEASWARNRRAVMIYR